MSVGFCTPEFAVDWLALASSLHKLYDVSRWFYAAVLVAWISPKWNKAHEFEGVFFYSSRYFCKRVWP